MWLYWIFAILLLFMSAICFLGAYVEKTIAIKIGLGIAGVMVFMMVLGPIRWDGQKYNRDQKAIQQKLKNSNLTSRERCEIKSRTICVLLPGNNTYTPVYRSNGHRISPNIHI